MYFTCEEHVFPEEPPAHNVILLPCIGSVPPEFWTVLLREDFEVIVQIDFGFCETCFAAGDHALDLFEFSLNQAQLWTNTPITSASTYPLQATVWDVFLDADNQDRRGALSSITASGLDIASGSYRRNKQGSATQNFQEQRERSRAQGFLGTDRAIEFAKLTSIGSDKLERPREVALVQSVQDHPQHANLIPRWFAVTNPTQCIGCGACVDACPSGARALNEETSLAETNYSKCFACGACVLQCPKSAIELVEGNATWFIADSGDEIS